jgi:hypothetical protein
MARKPPLNTPSDGIGGTTRASAVYEQLRSDNTHGILEPGSKLRVEAISSGTRAEPAPCVKRSVGSRPRAWLTGPTNAASVSQR